MILLEAKGVNVVYQPGRGERIWAVRDVSLSLEEGEFVGVVGESGCGKSTLGFALTQMLQPPAFLESGVIEFRGVDIAGLRGEGLRHQRRRGFAVVLQSGMNALNPVRTIHHQIGDVLQAHKLGGEHWSKDAVHDRGVELLGMVGLDSSVLGRFPHELSGGMRQRAAIALALALEPELIVFDEPTTALDVIVQAALMEMIKELQRARGFTALLISHDMSVVLDATDRAIVMYAGRIVEDQGSMQMVQGGRHHPYTEALFRCYADPRADDVVLQDIPGSPPDLSLPDSSCAFAPRCTIAEGRCWHERPLLAEVGSGGAIACHLRGSSEESAMEGRQGGA
ncbi:ABC transporter ATP-binding protein [Ferrimicrobium sp.]|uniref:ABC transporter ATP-binding protein n=1 Tax=Ferrimicrobium sp. TaxID=2926050 RepID=UPI0026223450|nr:ABC transporter ATP-binding protein [Ferrimicrobium sp.]